MAKSVAEIELIALVSNAAKTIQSFAKQAQKELSGISLNTTISALNDGFELVGKTAGTAFSVISDVIKESIDEASKAEQATIALTNALRIQNDYSKVSVKEFQDFASALQEVTIYSDESVLTSLALAKQFKATNSEAKKVVTVASDLAAITGTDLNDATFKVAQTLNGFVDKSLAKIVPGLRVLSQESLIAGKGIELISKQVSGSSLLLGDTFSGSVQKTKNAFSDLLESVGKIITENPIILESIKALGIAFRNINKELQSNTDNMKKFIGEGFVELIKSAPAIVDTIKAIDTGISYAAIGFVAAGRALGALGAAISTFISGNIGAGQQIYEALKADVSKDLENNSKRISTLYGGIGKAAQIAADTVSKSVENILNSEKKLDNKGPSKSGFKARMDENKKSAEELRKKIEEASKEPIKTLIDLKFNVDTKTGVAIGAGLVNNILKGAKGAQSLISSVLGAAADSIIPGLGGVASEIVGVLAQGKEEVRKQVQEFARSIPTIIHNLIEALPVLIEELAKNLPPALAKSMPFVAQRFTIELVKNIPQIIKGFASALVEAAKEFVNTILDMISSAGGILNPVSGKGSGGIFEGIPVLGGIGSLLGFAEGGRVPANPLFKGDKFPARLDAGEQVFSADLSNKLEQFLSGKQSGQPLVVNLVVGQQQLARAILDLNRGGFRTA